jgi:hypothetical protein
MSVANFVRYFVNMKNVKRRPNFFRYQKTVNFARHFRLKLFQILTIVENILVSSSGIPYSILYDRVMVPDIGQRKKFKRPIDASQPDKSTDIGTDAVFYNFESESKPTYEKEKYSSENPNETPNETTFLEFLGSDRLHKNVIPIKTVRFTKFILCVIVLMCLMFSEVVATSDVVIFWT